MSTFEASAYILQKVISVEECNGVVKTVTSRLLAKGGGDTVNLCLPLEEYMTIRGSDSGLKMYRKEGHKGKSGHNSEEEEASEEETGTRRSLRLKEKKRQDTAKEAYPPSSNESKKGKGKADDTSDARAHKGLTESNSKDKKAAPHLIEADGDDDDNGTSESEAGSEEENNSEGETEEESTNVTYLTEEFTMESSGEDIYNLWEEYRKVCEIDGNWINKQLRKFNVEAPKPIATELISKIELEGKLVPPDETDMDRGANLKSEMIMYNLKDLTTKGIKEITKCKVIEVDFSGGASTASVKFRVKGIYNGIRAIINVAKSGQAIDLYFKQAIDQYDKLRTVFINNTPQDIKNHNVWKEALRSELGIYSTVVDVMISRRAVTVTFARPREAGFFERKVIGLSIAGNDVTVSRTPFTIIRTPADVVVEGSFNDDIEEAVEAIAIESGPICKMAVVTRKERSAVILTFANYNNAENFVKRRKMTIARGQSNLAMEANIEWGRDNNTRKTKREDTEAAAATAESASILAKLSTLENKFREDRKAGLAEIKRMQKEREKSEEIRQQERKEDILVNWHMITESQTRVLSVVGSTLASIADKQTAVDCITDELADCRGERQMIDFQLMITEGDPSKATMTEILRERRDAVGRKITELQEKRNTVVSQRIILPALPAPSPFPLSLPAPKTKDNGKGHKRKIEVSYVLPDKEMVTQLTDVLKAKGDNREEVSRATWSDTFGSIIEKNLMQLGEVWSFLLPVGIAEKEAVISKF